MHQRAAAHTEFKAPCRLLEIHNLDIDSRFMPSCLSKQSETTFQINLETTQVKNRCSTDSFSEQKAHSSVCSFSFFSGYP